MKINNQRYVSVEVSQVEVEHEGVQYVRTSPTSRGLGQDLFEPKWICPSGNPVPADIESSYQKSILGLTVNQDAQPVLTQSDAGPASVQGVVSGADFMPQGSVVEKVAGAKEWTKPASKVPESVETESMKQRIYSLEQTVAAMTNSIAAIEKRMTSLENRNPLGDRLRNLRRAAEELAEKSRRKSADERPAIGSPIESAMSKILGSLPGRANEPAESEREGVVCNCQSCVRERKIQELVGSLLGPKSRPQVPVEKDEECPGCPMCMLEDILGSAPPSGAPDAQGSGIGQFLKSLVDSGVVKVVRL